MSDNQPFASREFGDFAKAYDFEQVTSSPNYPQSNGKIENAVKTAKRLMKRAKESGSDPYLALLDWRNTPRRYSTNNQHSAKELTELRPGDIVRLQPTTEVGKRKEWTHSKVEEKVDIRSYQVRTEDGLVFRRNKRHLRRTPEVMVPHEELVMPPSAPVTIKHVPEKENTTAQEPPPPSKVKPAVIEQPTRKPSGNCTAQPAQQAPAAPAEMPESTPGVTTTRSGEVVKPPDRFK
ncbi:uncharacterized protein LOC125559093 [Nematostella vectensis]|uniref:uncharacterized protein LOC125559093 n=1 Tax=Nematostella vectensis TaxID=45351 RepID=UPI002076E968|nr:uncharacterized protein LOC125559093 [Nematostella vectensis]